MQILSLLWQPLAFIYLASPAPCDLWDLGPPVVANRSASPGPTGPRPEIWQPIRGREVGPITVRQGSWVIGRSCPRVSDEVDMPNSVTLRILIGHLYPSGMWLWAAPWTDTKNTRVETRLDCVLKMWISVLGSIVNLIEGPNMINWWVRVSSLWCSIRHLYKLRTLRGKWLRPRFGIVSFLVLIVWFVSWEKWASWKELTFKAHLPYIHLRWRLDDITFKMNEIKWNKPLLPYDWLCLLHLFVWLTIILTYHTTFDGLNFPWPTSFLRL